MNFQHNRDDEIVELLKEIRRELIAIRHELKHHRFRILLFGEIMITAAGTSGTITATYTDNGAPATPTNPIALTCDDSTVTITPVDTFNWTVDVPAGDTASSITLTASVANSDGTTSTAQLTIPLQAAPQQFVLTLAQTA